MFLPATPITAPAHTSAQAVELLDELRIALLECVLVVATLPDETGLYFDGLAEELGAAYGHARQAHQAASLMHAGNADAHVDGRRTHPHAVLAEHDSAVRQGARRSVPTQSRAAHIERRVWEPVMTVGEHQSPPPACTAVDTANGQRCTGAALCQDVDSFGAYCYRHATARERLLDQVVDSARYARGAELSLGYQRAFGREVATVWIQRRTEPTRWFDRTRPTPD